MIIEDFVLPATLTAFVRTVPYPANFILNQFLPDRTVNDIEAFIDSVTRTNRAAKFRAYDAETPIGKRDTFERKRVLLPPLGQKTVLGEYERLQLERIRSGGTATDALVDSIFDDGAVNARAVHVRMELARGDVLTDGKFTLTDENGLTVEADFGVDASHFVSPSTLWSNHASATVLQDLRTWADTYTFDAGEPPAYLLASRTVISDMLQNQEIRQLASSLAGTPNIITRSSLGQILDSYGLPRVVEYNTLVDVNGTTTRPIPIDRAVFLPQEPGSLGYTAWGITAEALELAAGDGADDVSLDFEQLPGLIGVVMKEGDPIRVWTKVGAVGMPVITDPRKLMVADVR